LLYTVELAGFQTADVRLTIATDDPTPLRITLKIGFDEEVTVSATAGGSVLAPSSNADAIEFDPEAIRKAAAELQQPTIKVLRSIFVFRSRFAEDSLREAVEAGVRQFVVLGAGFDSRAYRLACLRDIDVFEVNEAFAPVLIAWSADTGASLDKTNPNGGAIALGHPLGATGAVLMTKLLHELERTGGRFGLQTMCEGGGQANATVIERVG